ncbi:MAG: hypothetical protein HUU49_01195 [Candidatus Buchananbacteria bacterium]|nr:hypothetical protein [Candidatus Buchananbacteria bacterium]
MNERRQELLKNITVQYIKTAQPVSSKAITESGDFDLSSATIRNEMAELEASGYIYHPHTSAGRMPTEKGYQYFVDNFLKPQPPSKRQQEILAKYFEPNDFNNYAIKSGAKALAEISNQAVFVAFADNDFFYTGISNLFSQPEFAHQQLMYDLTRTIDHLDKVIGKIFSTISENVVVSIGAKNPFARDCSSVIAKYRTDKIEGMIGIIGPMRMDYQNNFSLISFSQQLINNLK